MKYTAAMPVDVAAAVIANRQLSPDYNVLALRAPAIAASAAPGQFVRLSDGYTHYELGGPPDARLVVLDLERLRSHASGL